MRRPINFCLHILLNNAFNRIIPDGFFEAYIFHGTIDTLHEQIVFIGLRKRTTGSIPGQLLRGGWITTTRGATETLWVEADKHLTPAHRQVLEHNPVIKAVKGIDPPLTCVACGMLERTFHRDNIGLGVCLLTRITRICGSLSNSSKVASSIVSACPDRSRKEPHHVGDHTTISRGMGGNSQRAWIASDHVGERRRSVGAQCQYQSRA